MLSDRKLSIVLGAIGFLSALAAFSLVATAGQEYVGATCAQADCANCMQALESNSPVCTDPTKPFLCYSSNNVNSTAATGAWCIKSASSSPPTCNGSDGPNRGALCGTMKYWNCNCIASGAACQVCPCNPANPTGTWTPQMYGNICTNVAAP